MHAVIKYLGEYVLCCLFLLVSVCGMDTQLLHVCSVGRSWASLVWSNAFWAVVSLGNCKQYQVVSVWPSAGHETVVVFAAAADDDDDAKCLRLKVSCIMVIYIGAEMFANIL